MRDPVAWALPLGRLFGITIRVHIFFPFVAVPVILRFAYKEPAFPAGAWIDVSIALGLLFVSVLLHEFGHCFGARAVNGDAQEVLLWPLGGLASVDVPNTAWANFVTAAAGPLVNLVLGLVCVLLLFFYHDAAGNALALQPHWNVLQTSIRNSGGLFELTSWGGGRAVLLQPYEWPVLVNHLFWANWMLFVLNVVLVGFPMDGGRLVQCIAWPWLGYRQATLTAVFLGFGVVFFVGAYGIFADEVIAVILALFIYVSCKNQWIVLEMGGEDAVFGYDFSQGYTSLERDQTTASPPARRRPSWWQKWKQDRAAQKARRETEAREAEERRMDQLLEKVQREGITALTDEERRFMKRVSEKYRNRS